MGAFFALFQKTHLILTLLLFELSESYLSSTKRNHV